MSNSSLSTIFVLFFLGEVGLKKLEFHYTPKHGSWLNIAEIVLSVLSRQYLDCRIPDQEIFVREEKKWEENRNNSANKINWQFTTEDARIKLKRLYPTYQN